MERSHCSLRPTLLIPSHYSCSGFSLRRYKHFDVQREREKGQREESLTAFHVPPSLHSNAPLFCLKQTAEVRHIAKAGRERRVSAADWSSSLSVGARGHCFIFPFFLSFSPEVLFLMTGTKTREMKENPNLLDKKLRELSILAAGSTNL